MRAWLLDEYRDCKSQDERDDLAWDVPDHRGILYPKNSAPVERVDDAAEAFADYVHGQRDGWELGWPQDFVIDDGTKLWRVSVDRETVPEFHAGRPVAMTELDIVRPER